MSRNSNRIQCFLCRQWDSCVKEHKPIDSSVCPGSKKKVQDALQYLARTNKIVLHIPRNQSLCRACFRQLAEYDSTIISLVKQQRRLSLLVEKATLGLGLDEDLVEECDTHMTALQQELDEEQYFDVDVAEGVIVETVNEVLDVDENDEGETDAQSESHPCGFCATRFATRAQLNKHAAEAHKKYCCEVCDFSHQNEDYMTLHMNLHEGRHEKQCRFCDKEFTTRMSTLRHMEMHFDSKKYQCDKCGICFSQRTLMYNHRMQHEAEEHPLQCEVCNQVFKTKRTYRHHMITHRADRPRYGCPYCSKTFTEKYTLKVHKRTHPEAIEAEHENLSAPEAASLHSGSVQEAKFNCIICNCCFISKDQLNKHMEKEHDVILTNFAQYVDTDEPEAKKTCHICGHMFSAQSNLDNHLSIMHGIIQVATVVQD